MIGFSQGAGLAASFIYQQVQQAQQDRTNANMPFRCAVFICAPGAWDSRGEGRKLSAGVDGEVIRIPVANIVGRKDSNYESGLELSRLCDSATREVLDHGGGHEIPRGAETMQEMVRSITMVIDRALLMQ